VPYILRYLDTKTGADYVFTTCTGERVTQFVTELEKLGEHFGKKFAITPMMIRKQIATAVSQVGTEAYVRSTSKYVTLLRKPQICLKRKRSSLVNRYSLI